jgi:hypothetical protein
MRRREQRARGRRPAPPVAPSPHPSLCDFCAAPTPRDQLQAWPCRPFVLLGVVHDRALTYVCECHPAPDPAPVGTMVLDRRTFTGAWAACPACRADIDADRRHAILARLRAGQQQRREHGLPDSYHRGRLAMFAAHRAPPDTGSWQLATAADGDAESPVWEAQSSQYFTPPQELHRAHQREI